MTQQVQAVDAIEPDSKALFERHVALIKRQDGLDDSGARLLAWSEGSGRYWQRLQRMED